MNLLQILNYVTFVTFVQILIQDKLMTLPNTDRWPIVERVNYFKLF